MLMDDMIDMIARPPIPARCRPRGTITSIGTLSNEPAAPLSEPAKTNLAKWLAMVAKNDLRELPSIIAHEAVYHSPVDWHLYPGHDLVCLLVRIAAAVFERFKVRPDPQAR